MKKSSARDKPNDTPLERTGKHELANLDRSSMQAIRDAIHATLPKSAGQRNKNIFELCRYLKAIPSTKDLPPSSLRPVVQEWHRLALPVIGTKSFTETWADFLYGWGRVKYRIGEDSLTLAVQRATEAQYILLDEERYDTTEVRFLIRIFYELQKIQGEEVIWISCESASGILGVSKTKSNKYIQMLANDDPPVLKLVEEHTTNRATRYRFVGKGPIPKQAEGDIHPKQGRQPKNETPNSEQQGEAA